MINNYTFRCSIAVGLFCLSIVSFSQSTDWNESKLKDHWDQHGCDSIEGIYEQFSRPYLRLGLIKEDSIYTLIYIKTLLPELRYEEWDEGDLKALLTPSKELGEFYCTWYDVKKNPTKSFFIQIEGIYLDLLFSHTRKMAQFKKVYQKKTVKSL